VILSPGIVEAWNESVFTAVRMFANSGVKVKPEEIGVEYAEYNPRDGNLRIVGNVGKMHLSLAIPLGFWTWAN